MTITPGVKKAAPYVAVVLAIVFAFWSYTGKNRAEKRALIAQGEASVALDKYQQLSLSSAKIIKQQDEIIADARKDKAKANEARDKAEADRNAVIAKYLPLIAAIATMPPSDVVAGINTRIGPLSDLMADGNVRFTMDGAKFTLERFVKGERDFSLLTAAEARVRATDASNVALQTEASALDKEVKTLKLTNAAANATLGAVEGERDEWRTAFKKANSWLKIETPLLSATVLLILLKVAKVF
jgi:hypothetical protein